MFVSCIISAVNVVMLHLLTVNFLEDNHIPIRKRRVSSVDVSFTSLMLFSHHVERSVGNDNLPCFVFFSVTTWVGVRYIIG
jgi:hypothetical protein